MTAEIRRGSARFVERSTGRASHHSFSFGEHYDPERLRFGPMVCHDDHLLANGVGFDLHRHSGLVIVTWVVQGALAHTDGTGATQTVEAGSVAVLRTGDGVEHSEIAAAPATRFVQVWLTDPDPTETSYAVTPIDLAPGQTAAAAAPLPGATFGVARLGTGDTISLASAAQVHLYVATGALMRSSLAEPLTSGDALLLTDHAEVTVTAAVPTDLLIWTFDEAPAAVE